MERIQERWLLVIGAAIAIILLVVNVQLTFSNTRQLYDSHTWVAHTREVMDGLANLLSLMKDAETGQRGYLIAGDPSYLEPYNAAVASVEAQFEKLRDLTVDNDRQQVRFPLLKERLDIMLRLLAENVAVRRDKGLDAARKVMLQDEGKAEM
ncbi:MAG TPA: CHASE3 domain-containing protein, partial [Burkholderiales bacterium]